MVGVGAELSGRRLISFIDTTTFRNGVRPHRKPAPASRHRLQCRCNGSRLFARTAVRLADHGVVAGFPSSALSAFVVLLVQLTRWIV